MMISMNKKILFGVFLFILLIIVFPLVQSFIFATETAGKISVEEKIDASYLQSFDKDLMLVFFGYVGCVKVCTPILHDLDALYDSKEFEPLRGTVGLMFVNLMPQLEPDQPDLFAKSFNSHFSGVYLSPKELMSIDRELGVFFSKSLSSPGEIDHSDNLYLIKRQNDGTLVLKSIYTMHPLNRDALLKDIGIFQKEKE